MTYTIRETNNGFVLEGQNGWHGSFEFVFKHFWEAVQKMKQMNDVAQRRLK